MDEIEKQVREVVADAQRKQLEKPARACVNSEASFVKYNLASNGYTGVAARYWSWVCQFTGCVEDREEFGEEVFELQCNLDKIDKEFVMPSWGTYGT